MKILKPRFHRDKSKTISGFTTQKLSNHKLLITRGGCCNDGQEPPDDDPPKSAMATAKTSVFGG